MRLESGINPRPSRSGQDRRDGTERRALERRRSDQDVERERRQGDVDRRVAGRRNLGERRSSWSDRRQSDAARRGLHATKPVLTPRDRQHARELPAEFLATSGTPVLRVTKLIRRHWTSLPMPARADLAERLLPLLEPLANGGTVSDELCARCESAVELWAARVSARLSR